MSGNHGGKVLVTGGLGIIGAYVCRALLATSRVPVIYDAGSDNQLISDIARDCLIERGEIGDMPRVLGVLAQHQPTAILHLAGLTGPSVEQHAWTSLTTNLMGTATLFEAARLSGISRVVFPSSRQVYGPIGAEHRHPRYAPVPESHPREPVLLYGKLKRMCEDTADHYARLYGLDIVALRFGSAYGPGRAGRHARVSPVMALLEAAIDNRAFHVQAGADQADDLCYSGDSANAFIAAMDSAPQPGAFRAYNISAGELITLRQMIAILQELYPDWHADAGPGLDYRRLGAGYYFLMDISKARAELAFEPRFDFRTAALHYAETLKRLRTKR